MDKKELFFGTGNAHKLREIKGILGDRFTIRSFHDFQGLPDVEETSDTLEGNAELKARTYYAFTGIPCFADDTGLEVEALNGAPGVYSARYAGPEGDSQKNMDKLIHALSGQQNRAAEFRTVVAFYDGKDLRLFEGILEGRIAEKASGKKGFGYDPIFIPTEDSRSLAEFSAEEKNAISHRSRAVKKLVEFLTK